MKEGVISRDTWFLLMIENNDLRGRVSAMKKYIEAFQILYNDVDLIPNKICALLLTKLTTCLDVSPGSTGTTTVDFQAPLNINCRLDINQMKSSSSSSNNNNHGLVNSEDDDGGENTLYVDRTRENSTPYASLLTTSFDISPVTTKTANFEEAVNKKWKLDLDQTKRSSCTTNNQYAQTSCTTTTTTNDDVDASNVNSPRKNSTLLQMLGNTSSSMEKAFGLVNVKKYGKLTNKYHTDRPSRSPEMSTIGAMSTVTRKIVSLPSKVLSHLLLNLDKKDLLQNHKIEKSVLTNLASLHKIHTIKTVYVDLTSSLEFWEHFANLSPKLQCVRFELDSILQNKNDLNKVERATVVIQKILESSSDTLETIECFKPLGFLSALQIPVLSHIKELEIYNFYTMPGYDRWIMKSVFPPELSLSTVFPNVAKVHLDLRRDFSSDFWTTFFPHVDLTSNTWPSVTSLNILHVPPESLENISKLFPNLKNLVVSGVYDFPMTCRGIFANMKQLESLQFDGVHCGWPGDEYPAFDAALTGFSHETCSLLADSEETLEDVEVQKLRENLSILELKNLQTLKLTGVTVFDSLLLTRVSGIFAFQLMPQLKVTVTLSDSDDVDAVLKTMTPFIHSEE